MNIQHVENVAQIIQQQIALASQQPAVIAKKII
jgi:hypothetical protein